MPWVFQNYAHHIKKKPLIFLKYFSKKKELENQDFLTLKIYKYTQCTHKKEVIGSIFGSLSVAKTFTKECPKLSKDPLWCWALYPLMKSPCNISHIDKTDAFI